MYSNNRHRTAGIGSRIGGLGLEKSAFLAGAARKLLSSSTGKAWGSTAVGAATGATIGAVTSGDGNRLGGAAQGAITGGVLGRMNRGANNTAVGSSTPKGTLSTPKAPNINPAPSTGTNSLQTAADGVVNK